MVLYTRLNILILNGQLLIPLSMYPLRDDLKIIMEANINGLHSVLIPNGYEHYVSSAGNNTMEEVLNQLIPLLNNYYNDYQ